MAIEIQCPACMDVDEYRERCVMCQGKGIIVDTGAPPGAKPYVRPAPAITVTADGRRCVRTMCATAGALYVAADDGTVWAGGYLGDRFQWERLPDLPTGHVPTTQPEVTE
jgi:hypothetical protein